MSENFNYGQQIEQIKREINKPLNTFSNASAYSYLYPVLNGSSTNYIRVFTIVKRNQRIRFRFVVYWVGNQLTDVTMKIFLKTFFENESLTTVWNAIDITIPAGNTNEIRIVDTNEYVATKTGVIEISLDRNGTAGQALAIPGCFAYIVEVD